MKVVPCNPEFNRTAIARCFGVSYTPDLSPGETVKLQTARIAHQHEESAVATSEPRAVRRLAVARRRLYGPSFGRGEGGVAPSRHRRSRVRHRAGCARTVRDRRPGGGREGARGLVERDRGTRRSP